MGASQSVETKTWIFDEKDIRHLHEAVPGKVFVTCHDGQEHAGKTVVQVSGQAADLDQVQAHVRLHKLGSHLLELTATDNTGRQLVTQVFVDGSVPLETIESTKSRSFVMEDGTLDKNTAISKAGAGTIYINLTKDLSLEELTLAIHGSGVIEWISPRLAVSKQLAAVVDGSGRVNIHASHNLQAGTLHNSMTGSGSVLDDAANLISADVVSSVVGSGSIRHLQVGKAGNLALSVTGSGMIASSALSATNVVANVVGSGSILTQASELLECSINGAGRVQYVAPEPKTVSIKSPSSTNVSLVNQSSWSSGSVPKVPTSEPSSSLWKNLGFEVNLFGARFVIGVVSDD
ncbi:unnamed protein product [Aphanomyces euteiches]|uniref:Putative auto-transporter adhesin head GIN domain-containing protein n=1 Tax=Aphanomyces euteiches TaxID=100861 RepID=A0A6G0X9V0_9STRA|nr:hypothetical protein Ae201684_007008 [Aphanomyces euteiches]KAH9087253.1 hypothetical protein Ae201684P_000664 [Aphanomyces euteiches]KAH9133394.1 hypothetical protein AeRB84_020529 [Aphanomyces euteiches]